MPGDTEESVSKSLQTTNIVFDRSQRTCGNHDGLMILQELRDMREKLEESEREFQKALEESKSESRRAYNAAVRAMMELRAPIYQLYSSGSVGPKYKRLRDAVAHGGSVIIDLTILRHLAEIPGQATFTKWAPSFEKIYGMPFHYIETLHEDSKMVTVLNVHADILILNVYSSYEHSEDIKKKCSAIIRQWKTAVDYERDPEGIFNVNAVSIMYEEIVDLYNAAQQ